MSQKNVGHNGWPTQKILGFEWPKTAQMALKFLVFPGIFLNMLSVFLVYQKNFANHFLFTRFFL